MKTRKLTDKDKMLIIASDGVFEFLPSQTVVDMCSEHDDPLEACKYVVQTSKDEWLKRETRTDDITMICVFIDELDPDAANGEIQEGAFGLSEEEIAQASGD
uniref:PPM-type phosphatase domain-containing protein n=1 Tax=Leptocylindrus danicus TaxID=163516 RepID=A0A7S2LPV9_9STRA